MHNRKHSRKRLRSQKKKYCFACVVLLELPCLCYILAPIVAEVRLCRMSKLGAQVGLLIQINKKCWYIRKSHSRSHDRKKTKKRDYHF